MLRSAHASFFFGERLSAGLVCNHAGSEESERQEPDRWTGGARWRTESQPCESNSDIIATGRCLSLTYMSDVCACRRRHGREASSTIACRPPEQDNSAASPSMILQLSQVTMRLSCLALGSGAPLVHSRVGRPITEEEASTAAPWLCCKLESWTKGTSAGAKASFHERSRLLGQGSEQVPRLAVEKLAMADSVDDCL